MIPAEIQFELKKRKITQSMIADQEKVSPICISKTINRQMISDRLMRAISNAIGQDHRIIFCEYYLRPPKRSTSKN